MTRAGPFPPHKQVYIIRETDFHLSELLMKTLLPLSRLPSGNSGRPFPLLSPLVGTLPISEFFPRFENSSLPPSRLVLTDLPFHFPPYCPPINHRFWHPFLRSLPPPFPPRRSSHFSRGICLLKRCLPSPCPRMPINF